MQIHVAHPEHSSGELKTYAHTGVIRSNKVCCFFFLPVGLSYHIKVTNTYVTGPEDG